MRKWNVMILVFAMITVILAACDGNGDTNDSGEANTDTPEETEELAYTPEDIYDTDVCEVCAMAVPQNEHATQIILTNDRTLKFDDIGCLYKWKDENGEDDIGAEFVRDFHTEEWLQIKDATFVYDEEIMTPMAYGVISFMEQGEAEAFIDEEGKGELLDAQALASHEWKMNKEMMMDHGDHEDHEDHDDEHMEE